MFRHAPPARAKVHHFQHDIFMFYLDLDELDLVAKKVLLFSHNRKNVYSFRDTDHEPAGPNPLKERIVAFLQQNGIDLGPFGRVMLLTLPRIFGYVFNPFPFTTALIRKARRSVLSRKSATRFAR